MVDFINEVEEELRKDKYNDLLRKFGPYIVAVIIIIVAATGYIEYQKYSKGVVARKASASFMVADEIEKTGDLLGAIEKFIALSEVAPEGYSGLALSRAAGLKLQLGDLTGAVSLFDRASAAFTKPVHKDLAGLKAAYLLMQQERYDDVTTRASALIVEDAPYADLARELLAYAALKSDDTEAARTHFGYLARVPGVLSGVQRRAENALTLMNANREVPVPDAVTDIDSPESVETGAVATETDQTPAPEQGLAPEQENVEEANEEANE